MSITASEARKRFFPLIDEVNDDQDAVEVVSRRGSVFIVPEDQWHSMVETIYLLQSPANAARLLRSVEEHQAGRAKQRDLIVPDAPA